MGYFHKQYGTGTIVEEYMASMMVTLKSKLMDTAAKSSTILNVIEGKEETPCLLSLSIVLLVLIILGFLISYLRTSIV